MELWGTLYAILTQFSSQSSNISRSTVSNAELGSSNTTTKVFPQSVFLWMSLNSLTKEVPVLCCAQNILNDPSS